MKSKIKFKLKIFEYLFNIPRNARISSRGFHNFFLIHFKPVLPFLDGFIILDVSFFCSCEKWKRKAYKQGVHGSGYVQNLSRFLVISSHISENGHFAVILFIANDCILVRPILELFYILAQDSLVSAKASISVAWQIGLF